MEGIWGLQAGLLLLAIHVFNFFLPFFHFFFSDLSRITILFKFTICLPVLAGIPDSDLNFVSCSNHMCASFIYLFITYMADIHSISSTLSRFFSENFPNRANTDRNIGSYGCAFFSSSRAPMHKEMCGRQGVGFILFSFFSFPPTRF